QALTPASGVWDPEHGATGLTVNVTAPDDCEWVPAPFPSWIYLLEKPTATRGNGSFEYTVKDNEGSFRSGHIDVGGQIHEVYQNGADCPVVLICSFFPLSCAGPHPATVETARNFRDHVLARTPRGRRYTSLYYRFSREAVGILTLNPMLILRSREM